MCVTNEEKRRNFISVASISSKKIFRVKTSTTIEGREENCLFLACSRSLASWISNKRQFFSISFFSSLEWAPFIPHRLYSYHAILYSYSSQISYGARKNNSICDIIIVLWWEVEKSESASEWSWARNKCLQCSIVVCVKLVLFSWKTFLLAFHGMLIASIVSFCVCDVARCCCCCCCCQKLHLGVSVCACVCRIRGFQQNNKNKRSTFEWRDKIKHYWYQMCAAYRVYIPKYQHITHTVHVQNSTHIVLHWCISILYTIYIMYFSLFIYLFLHLCVQRTMHTFMCV